MKNLIPIFILAMISSIAIAGEDLSLACTGDLINQYKKNDGDFEVIDSTNSTQSFFFKNGILQNRIGNLRCEWSEHEIICSEFAKKFTKDTTLTRTVNINRITGAVQFITSGHGKNGRIISIQQFIGTCESQSQKF